MTDFSTLGNETQTEGSDFKPEPPPTVAGRVLLYDADFAAYQCGYKWEEESLEKSIENLRVLIQSMRMLAGAETIELHLTMGNKGGRYETAVVKEYQGTRDKRPDGLVERVGALREFMANCTDEHVIPRVWTTQEADDGLCQSMFKDREIGNNVLWSMDKDLWMVGGLHMHPKTYELEEYPWGFGECHLDDSTSTKKVVGKGTSFFWHQLLMGDTADAIPGLPNLSAGITMACFPTKKLTDAKARVAKATGPAKRKAALKALDTVKKAVKPRKCGAVAAYEYLKHATNDVQAYSLVMDAYREHYGNGTFEYTGWDGRVHTLTAGHMMLEQARLLWMRREIDEDVTTFFKEIWK